MLVYQPIPPQLQRNYTDWKTKRSVWLERSKKAWEYYFNDVDGTGTNFTKEQLKVITGGTNIPVTINYIHPIANQKLALLLHNRPSMKVLSMDGRAREEAEILDKAKHGVLLQSRSFIQLEQHIRDMLITGWGFTDLTESNEATPGEFGVSVEHVPYDFVLLDANSKKPTLSDMQGYFIEKEMLISMVRKYYPHIADNLKDEYGRPVQLEAIGSTSFVTAELTDKQKVLSYTEPKILVREYYDKVYTTLYFTEDEDGNTDRVFAENLPEEARPLLANAFDKWDDIFIRKTLLFNDTVVWVEMKPITDWSLKGSCFEWGGTPYDSKGMIHFLVGMQDACDKTVQLLITNGILTNNAGWKAPMGGIPDKDKPKWESHGNDPHYVKEYVPKVLEGHVFVPERDQAGQLGNFYPMILEMLQRGMEYSSGITPILNATNVSSVETFSTLQQYQTAAMQRVILASQHVNTMLESLGFTLIEILVSSIKPDTLYVFFDDKGLRNEVMVSKHASRTFKQARYKVVIVPSTENPSQRLSVATEMFKIAQTTTDPAARELFTMKGLEMSDIKEFQTMKEELDINKRLSAQVEQLNEELERDKELMKQLENRTIRAELEKRVLEAQVKMLTQLSRQMGQAETEIALAREMEIGSQKENGNGKQ